MINDYPELITEVALRSGITDVANRAKMLVGMAENALSKRLRLGGMESVVTLTTDNTGSVSLPMDYQEIRSIRVNDKVLEQKPIDVILKARQTGFSIQGNVLKSTYVLTPHDLVYYAVLPSLEQNNTSWLLADEPELYLYAVMFQAYAAVNDIEKAREIGAYLNELINEANSADYMQRHANTRINLGEVVA